MLKNLREEKISKRLTDKWSVKEHIGHLCDLEELWYGRIEDFLSGKETLRAADMTNAKTKEAGHQSKQLDSLLAQFSMSRNKLLAKVERIDEQTATITSIHPRLQKPMRLIDSLFFVAEHDDHHLAVIRKLIENS